MALSENMRGALFMVGSMTAFTVNDACMKALSDELPLFQAMFLRSLGVLAFMGAMAWRAGVFHTPVPRADRWLIALRTLVEAAAAGFFISALFNMPIANITAILQALPLTVTLAGAFVFREQVGWRRLTAILVGLAGVLLIVRPGTEGFNTYSVYALIAVALVTVRDLCARRISREVPTMTIAISAAFGVGGFSGLASIGTQWQPVSGLALLQLGGAALFVIGGYLFSVLAMRSGEIAFVAPFRYSSLLVALILGYAVFGDWPDVLTMVGASIVVGAGGYTLWREQRLIARGLRLR
ncbi:S-adenosylmethionine uptake transporter [Litoreibacter ponti]|uniref:S-adenosylmethionine uptake transporter n=1 Tax=Litoreibacter ponti TaxID=1510457 RepID=A0A2T6BMD7_9RHOB|nr:DMT family transporter [Litoreibacter ponti]PTX57240.1 S-adenosylmethionine uptake transporter [Litoreibacter ponti]